MKTSLFVTLILLTVGARSASAADLCADGFVSHPAARPGVTSEALKSEIERKVSLFENYPPYVLRHSTNYDQILLMSELASLSGVPQQQIAKIIEGVPNVTFRHTTSYESRIRIVTLSVLSGKSVAEVVWLMSNVPAFVRNSKTSAETYSTVVELAAITGKLPAEIARTIELVPDVTFGRTTSWSLRLWLAKIGLLANHSSYGETEALISSVPSSIFNYRVSSQTLSSIVELAAVSGVSPADIVKVIEAVPNATWGRATSFENRLRIAKLAVLSGKTAAEIESIGNSFPRYVLRHAATPDQVRFLMSLNAAGTNKKAWYLIDRPTPPEPEVGFWEALGRYLFE